MPWVKQNLNFSNLIKLISFGAAAVMVWLFFDILGEVKDRLFILIDKNEPTEIPPALWAQVTQLLSSFEKLAMLAAGTLLGVGVQEVNVRTAKKRVADKDERIKAARTKLKKKDSNGRKLLDNVESVDEVEDELTEALSI